MGGYKTRLLSGFNLVLEVFVNGRNVRIQVLDVEFLADTGKLRSVALGAGGRGLGVRSLRPLEVLLECFFGRVLLENDNVLVGDDFGGDFRHGYGLFFCENVFWGEKCSV